MADWGATAGGALSGASTGTAIGGPIGGVVGGLVGGISNFLGSKKKKKAKKRSTLDKNQKRINEQQSQGILGEGPLADLYNYNPEEANAVFDQTIGRKAQRQFGESTVPKITGAFRNEGLQNSSYTGQALSNAGRDVQENLDALRTDYLYKEKNNAKNNKINAIENFQNRTNFDYDTAAQGGGFDISSILDSITPAQTKSLSDFFSKKKQEGDSNAVT